MIEFRAGALLAGGGMVPAAAGVEVPEAVVAAKGATDDRADGWGAAPET